MPDLSHTPLLLLGALALTAAAAFGAQGFGRPGPPPPFDDHDLMMQKLHVSKLRRGPDPNAPSNSDESLANPYKDSMPDVLTMKDGTKVTTPGQWTKRRKEIAEDFEREVYGRVPKRTPKVTWEVTGTSAGESGGIPTVTKTLVGHVDNRTYPKVKVDIQASFTVPAHATQKVPMMIEFGFGFGFPGRPRPGTPWTQQAIEHGWGYGTINPNSIQPDNNHLEMGIIGLCNKGQPRKPDDWGALRAWAWGLSRMIDYFEKTPDAMVDARKVGIEGVSRYGKAAVVAEAFDPRVAVGLIGSSGEGGTKLHRHIFGEAIENLAGGEFYWMAGNIIKYGCDEPRRTAADLPVDSHELIALCAPRPVFISHGVPEKGDAHWIDVHGSFMAGVLAGPVYRLLGKQDFGTPDNYLTDPMPPVGTLIGGELAWRQHEGGHEVTPNWPAFFEWVGRYIQAPALPTDRTPVRIPADVASPRTDQNSLMAHGQLLQKAAAGGIDLYFLGDSITRRWGTSDTAYASFLDNWKANFYGWNAGNFGWGADATQNVLWRVKNGELEGVNPKAIVILAGTNNVGAGSRADEVARGVEAIVEACRSKAPKAQIVLTGIFPRYDNPAYAKTIQDTNAELARYASWKGLWFLDLSHALTDASYFVDGLHPNLKGYQIWAEGLRPILTKVLGPKASTDHAPPPTGDPSATARKG
jgi:lysophospholipase L1-like esterase